MVCEAATAILLTIRTLGYEGKFYQTEASSASQGGKEQEQRVSNPSRLS